MAEMKFTVCLSLVVLILLSQSVPISAREETLNPLVSRFHGQHMQQGWQSTIKDVNLFQTQKLRVFVRRGGGIRTRARGKSSSAIPNRLPCLLRVGFFLCISFSFGIFLF